MIIYAYVMGESVAALFLAGIIPGLMVGISLMVMVRLLASRYDLPSTSLRSSWTVRDKASPGPYFQLMTFVLVSEGLLFAITTHTDASAVAAAKASNIARCV